jgi:hypothetical protein
MGQDIQKGHQQAFTSTSTTKNLEEKETNDKQTPFTKREVWEVGPNADEDAIRAYNNMHARYRMRVGNTHQDVSKTCQSAKL